METAKKLTEKAKKFFEDKSKTASIILIIGCIGMALIFISEFLPKENSQSVNQKENSAYESFVIEENLEKRLEETISQIEGAGKTKVMLTLNSSKEYFYAKNSSKETGATEKSNNDEFVIIDGENGEEPVILKTAEAEIRGVLVICEGGANALVREQIIKSLCALLNIPSTRVSVAEMAYR